MKFRHTKKLRVAFCSVLLAVLQHSRQAHAVPTNILLQPSGTQADVQWGRLENDRFIIYYDSSQKALAQYALKAVERAYPDFTLLLGATLKGQPKPPELQPKQVLSSNFEKIPVVISARSDGPSFANFISQSLEIQSSELPSAALFQHELAHRVMYEHMDLNVGPAGRTFMLAMLPSWWTEGLPEYLTESLGRIQTNALLRSMALNGNFLSWDRLHALYKASGDTAARGYALSGRFFKYFFERTEHKNLRELHSELTWKQLIPPFFTGAYFVVRGLTGEWPGDLYESFKKDLVKEVQADLEGMPRLKEAPGISKIFSNFSRFNFVSDAKTIIHADFSTDSQQGGLVVYKYKDESKEESVQSAMLPLEFKYDDRIYLHPKEWTDGGFWTTSEVKASNRTTGQLISYQAFNGRLDTLKDSDALGRTDFPIGDVNKPPQVSRIVPLAPEHAAAITNLNTESKVYLLNNKLRQHTLLGQWRAPHRVELVRPHHAHAESESSLCAHVVVDAGEELTSVQRMCHGQSPQIVIPEGQLYIRDAIMLAPDDFILLTGWNDVQALVHWNKNRIELVTGLPDYVTSIEPAHLPETIMLRVYNNGNTELWQAGLKELKKTHLSWIITRPETSKWWVPPKYIPYLPPFARYADAIRKSAGTYKPKELTLRTQISPTSNGPLRVAQIENESESDEGGMNDTVPTVEVPAPQYLPKLPDVSRGIEEEKKQNTPSENGAAEDLNDADADANSTIVIPAPYRYRHWMTYPNFLPPILAGEWTFGFFSRPIVDELERFYIQLFGNYYSEAGIDQIDRIALEANLIGNRLFDGWKSNFFMRPRFNGLTGCKFKGDPKTYVCQLYLREAGSDLQWNRKILALDGLSDIHARLFTIEPSSRGNALGSPNLGAQKALLGTVGGSLSFDTWKKVIFDKPVSDLSKRKLVFAGDIRMGVDSTHSIGTAKAGDDSLLGPVSFQNYSVELSNSASFRQHSLTMRNTFSATGGGSPLNAREFFRPFKTYIIGANDGLQDISTAIAGNGLLNYNLLGRSQYRNSLSYTFPLVNQLDTRIALAYLEKLDGEIVLSRGGASNDFMLRKTASITTLTASLRLKIDVKGYQLNPAILYGQGLDVPLWQLFTQIKFDQFW
jgi:hypothetical protein